jgi:hypothetical protein
LNVAAGEPHHTLKDREEVPSAIVSGERVDFVDDNSLNTTEQRLVFDSRRHEHHLEGLRRREEHIRRVSENRAAGSIAYISVPHRGATPTVRCVPLDAKLEVVQKRSERADVENRQPEPTFREHAREKREYRRLRLAARGGSQQQNVPAFQ